MTGKQLLSVLDIVCKNGTKVTTDDFSGYNILDKKIENKYIHVLVNHSLEQYVNGDIHTNGLKFSKTGVYRYPSSL